MISRRLRSAAAVAPSTPCYVLDLDAIRDACRTTISAWESQFPYVTLAYSYKTNSVAAVTRVLREAGAAAEVVSGAELELALDDGHSPDRIYFDGPYKSPQELRRALALGVRIQVDSVDEARCLASLAGYAQHPPRVSLRVAGLRAGKELSRFGLTGAEVEESWNALIAAGIAPTGIHFNTGFHADDSTAFTEHLRHYEKLIRRLQVRMSGGDRLVVDIGGGFPAASTLRRRRNVPHPLEFATSVGQAFDQLQLPRSSVTLVIEPGRSLVEDHGVLVTDVVAVKQRERQKLVVVDAGTNLVRSIGLWPHPVNFLRSGAAPVDVVGSQCFEADYFARAVPAPPDVVAGDRLLIGAAGAYDIPSANVWIRPHPPIFGLTGDGDLDVIRSSGEEIRA